MIANKKMAFGPVPNEDILQHAPSILIQVSTRLMHVFSGWNRSTLDSFNYMYYMNPC